jgi:DMSO/TMAO reductase YedYZ molybdopterin-dependent catalytic subunit
MSTRTKAEPRTHQYLASTVLTMQLGVALTVLLGLMFFSGGLFFLYAYNFDIGPYFTLTRVIHFYVGLASIPFLVAKYGSTGFRFAGYYLRLPRFKRAGPPALIPRIFSPLLALDFFALYFTGLYVLFHYYYRVGTIPPVGFYPERAHLWAAILAVPLLAIHLGWHLFETAHGLLDERRALRAGAGAAERQAALTRRAFLGAAIAGGLGLSLGFQNTRLANGEVHGLFIGRIPEDERGGPGGFPVETLFGADPVDVASWRLRIEGAVARPVDLTYDDLLAMPAVTRDIRISCVSGWSAVPRWTGPRVRDVLARAGLDPAAKVIDFHSLRDYHLAWYRERVLGDDAILATHVNGAPLSPAHGFPVRLIVPGYPGQNMIKQITRIDASTETRPFSPALRPFG